MYLTSGIWEKMKLNNSITRTAWVLLICIGIATAISPVSNTQGARVVGGIEAGSAFSWDFNYTGTDHVGFGSVAFQNIRHFSLTVAQVTSDGDFILNYTDSSYRIRTPTIDPDDALKMLPLGITGSHSSATTLTVADIIAPISMISVNWDEQLHFFLTSPTLTTLPHRNTSHHTKYPFQGAWVDVHILEGTVTQTHFGENFNGYFRLVYSLKHGFMIEYEVELESISTASVMSFTATLKDSNMEIGYSFFQNILVGFAASFGFQWIYSLILIGIIFGKRRFSSIDFGSVLKDEEELEGNIPITEDDKIVPPARDLPEDYNFIYECPFCGEKFDKYERVCSECGGKR